MDESFFFLYFMRSAFVAYLGEIFTCEFSRERDFWFAGLYSHVFITVGYAIEYITQAIYDYPVTEAPGYNTMQIVISSRRVVEFSVLSISLLLDYIFTIRLIAKAIKSKRSSENAEQVQMMRQIKGGGGQGTTHSKLLKRVYMAQKMQTRMSLRLVSLCIMMWMIDSAIALILLVVLQGLLFNVNNHQFEMFTNLIMSWLALRVVIFFKLLEMLVDALKTINYIQHPSPTTAKIDSMADSSKPDVVEFSLVQDGMTSRSQFSSANITSAYFNVGDNFHNNHNRNSLNNNFIRSNSTCRRPSYSGAFQQADSSVEPTFSENKLNILNFIDEIGLRGCLIVIITT